MIYKKQYEEAHKNPRIANDWFVFLNMQEIHLRDKPISLVYYDYKKYNIPNTSSWNFSSTINYKQYIEDWYKKCYIKTFLTFHNKQIFNFHIAFLKSLNNIVDRKLFYQATY